MAIVEILKYPDPLLKEVSRNIAWVTPEITFLIRDLVDTMRESGGVGLAAPQIGVLKRVISVDVTPRHPGRGLVILINPKVVSSKGAKVAREGCLSVPDYTANIRRAEEVGVAGINPEGAEVVIEASGLEATALQHEIDHLDGILFLDRIESMKRDLFRRKIKNM